MAVRVTEVSIDGQGRLLVRPDGRSFDYIHRTASGVHWDTRLQCLITPVPEKWSYADWYRQIVTAVQGEYRQRLVVGPQTVWTNVPADVRRAIEDFSPRA